MNAGTLPILTYHAIDSSGAVTSTEPARFAETLDALLEAGFQPVDLARWIEDGRPPVDRGFALAFDDGLRSILGVADRLVRLKVPATIFVVTDRIGVDNDWPGQPSRVPVARLLGRGDIQALACLGFRFGSHGCSHQRMTKLNRQRLDEELIASRDRIEQIVGIPCPLLAYPYGSIDARVRLAASRIYKAAFGTRLAYASSSDNLHDLPRVDAYYLRSRQALSRLVAGDWDRRLGFRRAMRAVRGSVERVGLY
jgi:peptidoglycan/xylan/chitin deacetylase (PgdA/CDA1 family)